MYKLPNLDNAKACLLRAQEHYADFCELTGQERLWRLMEGKDHYTGEWFNRLQLDRRGLIGAMPVLADSATNVISALDHVVAAIARANGFERVRWLHYPHGLNEKDFKNACDKTRDALGDAMLDVLARVRQAYLYELPHIEAARQISNDGKHWEFRPADGKAVGIQLMVFGGGNRIFDLPADALAAADFHEFHRGARLPKGNYAIVGNLVVTGLDGGLPDAANSILEGSFRFVSEVINAVASAEVSEDAHSV